MAYHPALALLELITMKPDIDRLEEPSVTARLHNAVRLQRFNKSVDSMESSSDEEAERVFMADSSAEELYGRWKSLDMPITTSGSNVKRREIAIVHAMLHSSPTGF